MEINFPLIKFFVEGKADEKFLVDILKLKYDVNFSANKINELIIKTNGFTNLEKQVSEFREVEIGEKREGGINIVLFDADYSNVAEHHGFDAKNKYLNSKKEELKIQFETFLFPNNSQDGTIETLLESCINNDHESILSCWKSFEDCVNNKENIQTKTKYTLPANKSKIYVYLECLHGTSNSEKEKIKDPNRDFTNTKIWTIKENEAIQPLYNFLDQQFYQ